jgi:two-component system phosphate regulon sensor histidine kinase PhoR
LGPEEIIAIHAEALEYASGKLTPRQIASAGVDGLQFLLEVMIAYGVQYQRYLELRLAEQLRRTEEAQRAARTQADIMANISHELRTPVTVVRGTLDLAVRSLAQQQHDKVAPLLEAARQALGRLSRMTADLYEASRGETPELMRGPEDLATIAAQAHAWATAPAAEKGIHLTYQPGATSLPVVGDGDALLSALGNLISNAIRYTPAGGQVAVRTGGDDACVWVEVSDTGIGMTPEVQAQIFEKFYRAPEARAAESSGLGLGLALTRQIVLAHEGDLSVTSAPGVGSTFRITLPRFAVAADQGAAAQEETTRHDRP